MHVQLAFQHPIVNSVRTLGEESFFRLISSLVCAEFSQVEELATVCCKTCVSDG